MSGSFKIDDRSAQGFILVEGFGFWSLAILDVHFDQLLVNMNRKREAGEKVRVLIDLREADVQPAGIVERIAQRTSEIYAREDSIAIVVASSLARMQMRRAVQRTQHEVFESMLDARDWLSVCA